MSKEKSIKTEENVQQVVELETLAANELVIFVKGKEERVYRFEIKWGSPLDEACHAALNVAKELARLHNEAVERQKKGAEKETD